jgi:Tat protein secretion system quality control protein TatD with DNase activity
LYIASQFVVVFCSTSLMEILWSIATVRATFGACPGLEKNSLWPCGTQWWQSLHCFIGTQENAMQWMGGFPNLKFGIANLINKPNVIDEYFGCNSTVPYIYWKINSRHLMCAWNVGEIQGWQQHLCNLVESQNRCNQNLRWQLETAKLCWLPVVFHCRDMNNLMFSEPTWHLPREYPIHLHCFIGTQENAIKYFLQSPISPTALIFGSFKS